MCLGYPQKRRNGRVLPRYSRLWCFDLFSNHSPRLSNLDLLDKDNVRSERTFILHHTSPHNIILNLRILKTFLRNSTASSTLQTPAPTSKPVSSNHPHDTSLSRFLHAQRGNGLPRRLYLRSIYHRHGMSL